MTDSSSQKQKSKRKSRSDERECDVCSATISSRDARHSCAKCEVSVALWLALCAGQYGDYCCVFCFCFLSLSLFLSSSVSTVLVGRLVVRATHNSVKKASQCALALAGSHACSHLTQWDACDECFMAEAADHAHPLVSHAGAALSAVVLFCFAFFVLFCFLLFFF